MTTTHVTTSAAVGPIRGVARMTWHGGPLRTAVLAKQIPAAEKMQLGHDGRLIREDTDLEMSAYCRREVSQSVELVTSVTGGTVAVFTLGPPAAADVVIGVGHGVAPEQLGQLDERRETPGAQFACTRKVTDAGWMPHARRVGVTGRATAPDLYVAIGTSSKFNHMVGVHAAGRTGHQPRSRRLGLAVRRHRHRRTVPGMRAPAGRGTPGGVAVRKRYLEELATPKGKTRDELGKTLPTNGIQVNTATFTGAPCRQPGRVDTKSTNGQADRHVH